MRVGTEEWRRFIPGVRMYKGKRTYFYNGENHNWEDRESWEVIIILPGVEVIPESTFNHCENVKTVIMADSVRRMGSFAFCFCESLSYVRLSRNLEFIGESAFDGCSSLTSIFIPPSCREIGNDAFLDCDKLIIFSVPQNVQLGRNVISGTALFKASSFETNRRGLYEYTRNEEVNDWIRNLHVENQFSLHRACRSYNPLHEVIFDIVKRQGLKAFKKEDSIGVTASQYLSENPYTEIEEQNIIKRYILDMMGEVI